MTMLLQNSPLPRRGRHAEGVTGEGLRDLISLTLIRALQAQLAKPTFSHGEGLSFCYSKV